MLFKKVSADSYTESNIITKKPYSFNRVLVAIRRDLFAWVLIAPALFFFICFVWEPLIIGLRLSFYSTQGFDLVQFRGLGNFRDALTDSLFIKVLMNTVKYTLWSLLIGLPLPIFTAIVLNEMGL